MSHIHEFSRKSILKLKMRYFGLTVAHEGECMRGQMNPENVSLMYAIASRSVWNTHKHVSESLEALEKYSERYISVYTHHFEFLRKPIFGFKMSHFGLTVAYEGG